MLGMALMSIKSFFSGTLFANNPKAFGTMVLGAAITAVLFIVLIKAGVNGWCAAALAGLAGGALQPFLLRNVKYR